MVTAVYAVSTSRMTTKTEPETPTTRVRSAGRRSKSSGLTSRIGLIVSRPAELSVTVCTGKPGRVCPSSGGSLYGRMPCKRRICPSYVQLWAYDWRIVLLENLIAYAGKAVLYTLTPPGRTCCRGIAPAARTPRPCPARASVGA